MKYIFYLLIFFVSFTCFAQRENEFSKTIKDAQRLVYKQPDSALVIVKRVLAKPNLPDTIYGSMYNIYGIYYGMRGNNDSLIYYQKKSISYLDNYPEFKARSLANLGVGYRNKGEYNTAISTFNAALEINRKIKNDTGIAVDYGELASVYNTMGDYEKSINLLISAIDIVKKDKKQDKLPALQQKLANTYLAQRNFKFAIDLYMDCLPNFKKMGQLKNYYLTLVNLAEARIHLEDLSGAKSALAEAIKGLEDFGDKSIIGISYGKLGNIEEGLGNHAKALASYKKGLELMLQVKSNRAVRVASEYIGLLNKDKNAVAALALAARIDRSGLFENSPNEDKMFYKKAVGDAYSNNNNESAAIKAYQETIVMKDSIAANDRQTAIGEAQAKFETELQREKNAALQANNKSLQKTIEAEKTRRWLYGMGILAIGILILLALRGYFLKSRLQAEQLRTIEAEKNMIQQQHLHEQELTNAQREIIDEKQRELTSTALRMANFQDGVMQIIDKCNTGEISKMSDLKKELQTLAKQEDYWKQFETRFNNLHPEFGNSLQHRFTKLTKNDIEFCSLLKLNLSNKEIASLLQISHESAITKKYRIKKKMEINDDDEFERMLTEM
ncbi:tetratricopeptide repeat protein [Flavobacterium psychrotrophum]|uniref:tetratricopeptide repeat protein n=1 Tax=Flavobacterium psychrotrophum TaxID=2294119 RepID=UPI000E321D0B|nr:transcriptional regulator [Flavobacterium psychrotrophum]